MSANGKIDDSEANSLSRDAKKVSIKLQLVFM